MILRKLLNTKLLHSVPLQHDPRFHGPDKNRSCTDVIFLLIFIVFLVVWGGLAFYAVEKGDPGKLFMAVDSQGRRCGRDSEVLDKKYLFFFDLTACATPKVLLNGCDTPQVCVSECPKTSWASLPYRMNRKNFNLREIRENLICKNEKIIQDIKTWEQFDEKIRDNSCADWYVSSKPVHGRCVGIGNNTGVNWETFRGAVSQITLGFKGWLNNYIDGDKIHEVGGQIVDDLINSWRLIVAALAIAILVSLFYITLLRWIAGIITWLSLFAVIALMITICIFSLKRYIYLRDNGPDEINGKMLEGKIQEIGQTKEVFLGLTIIVGILAAISLLLVVFLRKRIQIAITLIKEGSKAVSNVVSALFFPLIPWCFQLGVILYTVFVWFHLQSVGEQVFKARGLSGSSCKCHGDYEELQTGNYCDPFRFKDMCQNITTGGECTTAGCHFFKVESPTIVTYFHIYNIFGGFWGVWFIFGLSDMILAGTFAKWYWTFKKSQVPFFAVTASAGRTIRYHLGTIAFGSLIISICSFIRAVIEYLEKKSKNYDNTIVNAMFCCLKCFFWCLEKFLRFINRNAYIMCAMHGGNFCKSAKDAFNLLMRNIIRVVVLDKVTDFLFFVGKIVITGAMVSGTYFLWVNKHQSLYHFNGSVPLVAIGIGSYIIASIFFGVYSMAVDTLFLCFLEDCERNDGSKEKPYYMSKNLMRILGKKNRKQK